MDAFPVRDVINAGGLNLVPVLGGDHCSESRCMDAMAVPCPEDSVLERYSFPSPCSSVVSSLSSVIFPESYKGGRDVRFMVEY